MVPRWMWHASLAGLALVNAAVLAGALALALGTANPPTAGPLQYEQSGAGAAAYTLPAVRTLTAEIAGAVERGAADEAFGLWLRRCGAARRQVFALDGAGYVKTDISPGWVWFPHALPMPAVNRLRLHMADGKTAWYVNDEEVRLAGSDTSAPVCAVGTYTGKHARLLWVRVWHR